jgi:hypothetical protein
VYLSANPYADLVIRNKVFKLISVWKTAWDSEYGTVLPCSMYESALDASERYPDKRLVVHFVQPHYPYIKFKSLNLSSFDEGSPVAALRGESSNKNSGERYPKDSFFSLSAMKIYSAARLNTEKHFRAYRANLEEVLPYAKKLAEKLPGKTIISSDHGEAFGEKINAFVPIKIYGHFNNIRAGVLVKVPWFVAQQPDHDILGNDR